MTRDQLAREAYQLAARIRTASHTAFGDVAIGPADALRIERLLDVIAEPVQQRKPRTEAQQCRQHD